MDNINHSDEFENQEYARLVRLFKKFDAAYKKGTHSQIELSEDEYDFIIDSYIERENLSMATEVAAAAFAKYPYSSIIVVKYCDSLILNNKIEEAESLLDKYKNTFPDYSELFLLYARIYIKRKQWSEARAAFSQAIEIEPCPEDICDSVYAIAQDCIELKNYREAIFYLDRSNELTKKWDEKNNCQEDKEDLADSYNDYALCYERLGKLEKSAEYYKKYLDINPFDDMNWFNIGTIYARLNKAKESVDAFEYAVSLNRNNAPALFNLGIISLNLEEFKNAVEYFTDFCRIEKLNIRGTIGLADAYMGLGDYGQAEILFRKALMLDKNCKEAKEGIACLKKIKKSKTNKPTNNK
jgi:tetratricopeptide (TPR) repeat protein